MNTDIITIPNPQPKQFRSLSATFAELEASRQAKKSYPQMGHIPAIIWVATTVIILTFSFFASLSPILIFYALWLPQIFIKGTSIIRPSRDFVYVMLLPLLACVSTFWSDYKSITLYHAAELASMVVCIIIITRITTTQDFLKGVIIGSSVVLFEIMLSGNYSLLGSKNQTALIAEIGVITSLIILFSNIRIITKILFALFPLIFCSVMLVLSHSASSDISMAGTLGAIIIVYIITKFPKRSRIIISIFSLLSIGALTFVTLNLDLEDAIFHKFGKDSTLTGRTYLWNGGTKIGMKNPVLGIGYTAFWVPGQPEAEQYWFEFDIPGKSGFHFHSVFIESFVELGVVGVVLMSMLILMNVYTSFRAILKNGLILELLFPFAISFMFFIRSFVEVDILGPFGIGPLLFFTIVPRLAKYAREHNIGLLSKRPNA